MFTGIIEDIGSVETVQSGVNSAQIRINSRVVPADLKTGDSVSINGVCLTVTAYDVSGFTVEAVPETMSRSNLGNLHAGAPVNLERALRVGDRMGGHMMSGHVDSKGIIQSVDQEENAVWYTVSLANDFIRYLIPKGSVGIDGISLTVVDVSKDSFTVSVIPHTLRETTLAYRKKGDEVNIECDMTAKYIERFLTFKEEPKKDITMDYLKENGYL
ncbi:MAG: riboflavin synthase [Bacteroidales bacterium]|nr:riboflavin synthase [Bacteroidales bacterium]